MRPLSSIKKNEGLVCEIDDMGFELVKSSYFKEKEMIIIFEKFAMSAMK